MLLCNCKRSCHKLSLFTSNEQVFTNLKTEKDHAANSIAEVKIVNIPRNRNFSINAVLEPRLHTSSFRVSNGNFMWANKILFYEQVVLRMTAGHWTNRDPFKLRYSFEIIFYIYGNLKTQSIKKFVYRYVNLSILFFQHGALSVYTVAV